MVDIVPGRPEEVHSDITLPSRSRAGLGGALRGLSFLSQEALLLESTLRD